MKKLSAVSDHRSAFSHRLSTDVERHASIVTFVLLTAYFLLLADTGWSAAPTACSEITAVADTVIGLVNGVVGKMLAFLFLAGGAVAAFVGKWGYVAGGVGGGLILIIGPKLLTDFFTGTC